MKNLQEQLQIIKKGVVEILTEDELIEKLKSSIEKKEPLRIKLGIDPTAPDVHLGFTVQLRKLKQFQDLDHQVIIIIGSFTARLGDPSGQNITRPQLSYEDIMRNVRYYEEQIFKILDKSKTQIFYNGDWFSKFKFTDVIKLTSKITIASLLEHDYFGDRYDKGIPISLHEFIYPLLQGFDSVEIKADIEIGGTDQRFNVIVGRSLQKDAGQEPQIGLFLPILIGIDGKNKMSKSLSNYIGINEPPKEMYGKIMSIPDGLMLSYFELLTDVSTEEIKKDLEGGLINPKEIKKRLAKEIVGMYYDKNIAEKEELEFERIFKNKELPEEIPEIVINKNELKDGKIWIIKLLQLTNLVKSKNEAMRLISQGGVSLDNEKIKDSNTDIVLKNGSIIKVGKRKFVKIGIKQREL
ncbi:MAG: tyrosine--tRNA ligase [Candidatus Firestonebacteria bacterium]